MNELRPGLSTWSASHPDWTPADGGPDGWEREVRSYALDAGDSLVLFDPLVEVIEVEELAAGRPIVVVLTCGSHARSSAELVERLGAVVHAPAESARELDFPIVAYAIGDDLPGDVEPHPGGYASEGEATLWLRSHRGLVIGDAFLGGQRGFRLQPESWLEEGMTRDELRARLRPLADLPLELLLPTHGDPVAEDAREVLRAAIES